MKIFQYLTICLLFSIQPYLPGYSMVSDDYEVQRSYLRHLHNDRRFTYREIAENIGNGEVHTSTVWKFSNNNNNGRPYYTSPKIVAKFKASFIYVRRQNNIFNDNNAKMYINFICNSDEVLMNYFINTEFQAIRMFHNIFKTQLFLKNFKVKNPNIHQAKFSEMPQILRTTLNDVKRGNDYSLHNFLGTLAIRIVDGQPLEDGNHRFSYYLCQKILNNFGLTLDMNFENFKYLIRPDVDNDRNIEHSNSQAVEKFSNQLKRKFVYHSTSKKRRNKITEDTLKKLSLS